MLAEAEQAAAPPPVTSPALPSNSGQPGISFRNLRAVGVSIGVAVATLFVMGFAFVLVPAAAIYAIPIIIAAGGFIAAVLYTGQTKAPLTGAAGARLGWMTGLWFMLVILLFVTLAAVAYSGPSGQNLLAQLKANPQFAEMKFNPKDIPSMLFAGVIQMFFVSVLLFMFGGVIGARYSSRHHRSA